MRDKGKRPGGRIEEDFVKADLRGRNRDKIKSYNQEGPGVLHNSRPKTAGSAPKIWEIPNFRTLQGGRELGA